MITVAIPTMHTRGGLLRRALASVYNQTRMPDGMAIAVDNTHAGAAATRNRALRMAIESNPEGWIALLDDDDELLPNHIELLVDAAEAADVGVAWGWYTVEGGIDPLPADFRGRPYDPDAAHCVPITYIARADLFCNALDEIGGFDESMSLTGAWDGQDECVLSHMVRAGGHIALPDTTWTWHHHPGNTSGRPDRW